MVLLTEQQEIILDTGPLLQILVGLYDPKKLEKLNITPNDFGLLSSFTRNFKRKLVTPHILAELSNLAKIRLKDNFEGMIVVLIRLLTNIDEEPIDKNIILKEDNLKLLQDFGITDTAISLLSNKNRVILTDDAPFFAYCYNNQIPVIHTEAVFNKAV